MTSIMPEDLRLSTPEAFVLGGMAACCAVRSRIFIFYDAGRRLLIAQHKLGHRLKPCRGSKDPTSTTR